MNKAIVGVKLGMSQIFAQDGRIIPVTVIEAGPCPVVQKKTVETDGYEAIQVAFGEAKKNNVTKPITGHYKKSNVEPQRYLRELKLENSKDFNIGQVVKCDIFTVGDHVDVVGTSRGRGFSGNIFRWNAHIGPKAHGSGCHRVVGSMSSNTDPARVFKNKLMPGHYGHEQVTVQNLEIARIDTERNLLLIKGAIPGTRGGLVVIKESVKG
jgi:large subunit ribosomal protein L3